MAGPPQANSLKAPSAGPSFIVAAMIVVAVGMWLEGPHAVAVGVWHGHPYDGLAQTQAQIFFTDPDDYMRTYRAKLIAEGHTARIRHLPEINAPAGAELHWTAPMDYLLAGAGLLFAPLVDHADPFGYVAAWVPMCLGILFLVSFMAMMCRGFGAGPAILAGLLVVLSPAFHRVFQVGHPDHHCLLELMLLVALGGWIPRARADGAPGKPSIAGAIISGIATGLAIWIASQALVFWFTMVIGLTYACLFGPPSARRQYASARLAWNTMTAIVVVAGYFIENWPDLTVSTIDKISNLHLALISIAFLAPTRVGSLRLRSQRRTPTSTAKQDKTLTHAQSQTTRSIALLAAMAAFTIWMAIDRNRTLAPFNRPEFRRLSENTTDLQPLYTQTYTDWSVQPLHDHMGYLPYGLPVLLVFFLMSKQVPRSVKGALSLLAPLIMGLTILQVQWLDHFNLAITPVVVIGIWELVRTVVGKAGERMSAVRFTLAGAALVILICPSAKTILTLTPAEARRANAHQERTDFVAEFINAREAAVPSTDSQRRAILCEGSEGPMLLYCTGLPVVAVPYHRSLDGLVEAARFYAERDPWLARRQLDKLGVRYVVLPPRARDQLMQFEQIAFGELRSFNPPTETINQFGRILRKANYKPQEITQTMIYRLVHRQHGRAVPGIERIADIEEDTPDGPSTGTPARTGLLYHVSDMFPTKPTASAPVSDD